MFSNLEIGDEINQNDLNKALKIYIIQIILKMLNYL